MADLQKVPSKIWIILLLLLAFALRVAALDQIPAGLSHDEAYNGVTAMQVLNGEHRIFFEINKGIEPLIIYLEALAFYFLGIGPVPLRLVNVAFGMLTVALVYPFTARLFNRRVALLAMAGVAISFWAVFVSRLTLRAVLLPPFLLLTLYFFWRAVKPSTQPAKGRVQLIFWTLSGLAAGVTMYTYLASRFVPLIILALFGYQLLCRQVTKQQWLGLLLHFVIWAALFAPLAGYFWQNRDSFTRRSGQVTTIPYALNGNFEPVLGNTLRTLGMFTFSGDTTGRYNLNKRPLFDWANGLLFYGGLALIIWRVARRPGRAGPQILLLSATFFMLLPDFITDDSPHFLRTIGALPFVYIFWAVGLNKILYFLPRLLSAARRSSWQPLLALLFLLLLISLTTLHTAYDYFGRWAQSANARYIYGADIAAVADYMKSNYSDELTVISAEYYRDLDPFRQTLHFGGSPPFVIWFDGRQTLAFPPAQTNLSPRYIFLASAPPADFWLNFLERVPQQSTPEFAVYRLPASTPEQLAGLLNPLGVNINNDLILAGYQLLGDVTSGGKFQVVLGWQALRALPPGTDYTFLVQMRDAQGHLWAEADGNGYKPVDWQPGVQGLQLLTLRLPGDLPPRTFHLTAQVVDRRSRQALASATGQTVIALESVTAQLSGRAKGVNLEQLPNPRPAPTEPQRGEPPLALRGYELGQRRVRPGVDFLVTLHWQVLQQPRQSYRLQFFLVNPAATMVHQWPAVAPVGGEWPTNRWPTGYWVQDKISLPVTAAIPSGQFELRVGWVNGAGQNATGRLKTGFELGPVYIEAD